MSTAEQGQSGHGLDAQRDAINQAVASRGWIMVECLREAGSGASTEGRTEFARALHLLAEGEADALVVAKADRAARSTRDLLDLADIAEAGRWQLVILDLDIDTTTPAGRLVLTVLAGIGQWERDVIRQRTREGLAAAKAKGVRLGGRRSIPDKILERIRRERAEGRTLAAIAKGLDDDDIPTSRGGVRWYPSTVAAVLS